MTVYELIQNLAGYRADDPVYIRVKCDCENLDNFKEEGGMDGITEIDYTEPGWTGIEIVLRPMEL